MNRLFTTLLFFSCTFSLSAQQIVAKIQLNGTAEILPAEIPAQVSGGTPTENRFGEPNSAMRFNGENDFILFNNVDFLNFDTSDFAVAFWMKGENSDDIQTLIHKGGSTSDPNYYFRINGFDDFTRFRFFTGDGTPPNLFMDLQTAPWVDGQWHHVLGQRKGNQIELYIDCELVATREGPPENVDFGGGLILGAQHPNYDNPELSQIHNYFEGALDDIWFFRGSFTLAEIKKICGIPDYPLVGVRAQETSGMRFANLSSTGRLRFFDENGRTVEVFDMQGKRVARTEFKPALDLDNLPSGVYLIVVSDDKGRVLLREKTLIISSIRP